MCCGAQRFKGSADAIKFTQRLGDKIEKEMKDADLNKYSFLLEAIDKLIAARRILQWTYSLAYYLRNGGQKHLFEYQQEMLLGNTEALQDVMENNSLEKLLGLRKDIINKTSSMDKFRAEMVAQVERGEFDELLLSHADIGMDTWACVNCRSVAPSSLLPHSIRRRCFARVSRCPVCVSASRRCVGWTTRGSHRIASGVGRVSCTASTSARRASCHRSERARGSGLRLRFSVSLLSSLCTACSRGAVPQSSLIHDVSPILEEQCDP